MKIYCVFDRYSVDGGESDIDLITEFFLNEDECRKFVDDLNKKVGGSVDYKEVDGNIHMGKTIVVEPMCDDDKYATEVTCGGTRILPPENHLVGTVTQTERGFVVEFIDKSKLV